MTPTPDRLDQLMKVARRGDRAAYRDFLAEAAGRLRAFFARRMGRNDELEDLVQECLMAMHDKRNTLDPGRPVAPWMYAIARYKLADWWRRTGREARLLDSDTAGTETIPTAAHDVAALMARLPLSQAKAIQLTKIKGLSGEEAAGVLGIGPSAVKVRVHRGLARLRQLVRESGE